MLNTISLFYFNPPPPCFCLFVFFKTTHFCSRQEQTCTIWTWLPAFLVPDYSVWELCDAQGWLLEKKLDQKLGLHLEFPLRRLWWKRFLKDTSETHSHPFVLPGKLPPTAQQLGQTHSTISISRGCRLQELEVLTASWQLIWNRSCKSVVLKFGS